MGCTEPSLHCCTVVISTLLLGCAMGVLRRDFPLPRQAETYAEACVSASRSWDGLGAETRSPTAEIEGRSGQKGNRSLGPTDEGRVVDCGRSPADGRSTAGFCFCMSLG